MQKGLDVGRATFPCKRKQKGITSSLANNDRGPCQTCREEGEEGDPLFGGEKAGRLPERLWCDSGHEKVLRKKEDSPCG